MRVSPHRGLRGARKSARARRVAEGSAQRTQKAERPKQEQRVTLSLRLPESIHAALKDMAEKEGRSATKQVEMLIRRAIAHPQEPAEGEQPSCARQERESHEH